MLAQYRGSGANVALATFAHVREAIERELAATPDTELLELRLAIERHDPTLAGPTAGLPVPITRFVGRERELGEMLDLLGTTRLLTLTGPGGSGKSRMALELARAMAATRLAEVHFVALAALPPGGSVTRVIAAGLEVRERRGEPLVAGILYHLRQPPGPAGPRQLRARAGDGRGLSPTCSRRRRACASSRPAASRSGLRARSPAPSRVWGSRGPGAPPADSLAAEAMQLLAGSGGGGAAGVRPVRPGGRACGRALPPAGWPAARDRAGRGAAAQPVARGDPRAGSKGAWTSPRAAATRRPERHRTMRAAIDWSYDLLAPTSAGCFVGWRSSAAASTSRAPMAVWGDPLPGADPFEALSRLVDQSMVVASPGPGRPDVLPAARDDPPVRRGAAGRGRRGRGDADDCTPRGARASSRRDVTGAARSRRPGSRDSARPTPTCWRRWRGPWARATIRRAPSR